MCFSHYESHTTIDVKLSTFVIREIFNLFEVDEIHWRSPQGMFGFKKSLMWHNYISDCQFVGEERKHAY